MTKRKKIIILVSMVALLVITGVLNIVLNNNTVQTSTLNTEYSSATFFTTYRTDRTNSRNDEIAYYKELIAQEGIAEETKLEYEGKITKLVEAMTTELTMEGLIKAKGFEEAVVSYSDTYINVILKGSELTENEITQVVDIVQGQTGGRDIDFIKIIPVE